MGEDVGEEWPPGQAAAVTVRGDGACRGTGPAGVALEGARWLW